MGSGKVKGMYKGLKYSISQIFVVKEREMEIGYPTDVKHLAHIGWDAHSSSPPTWMNEFQTGPDFASNSVSAPMSLWSSQDFSESTRQTSETDHVSFSSKLIAPPLHDKKKQKRKKSKSTSSSKSNPSSSSRPLRVAKSLSSFIECSIKPPATTH